MIIDVSLKSSCLSQCSVWTISVMTMMIKKVVCVYLVFVNPFRLQEKLQMIIAKHHLLRQLQWIYQWQRKVVLFMSLVNHALIEWCFYTMLSMHNILFSGDQKHKSLFFIEASAFKFSYFGMLAFWSGEACLMSGWHFDVHEKLGKAFWDHVSSLHSKWLFM